MKFHVVGTGGVGGYFGGLLAHRGEDVTFVARGEHHRRMRDSGLRVQAVRGDFLVERPQVVDSISGIRDPELVLVFVKTYHTVQVAQELKHVVTPATTVITFQTGLENDLEFKNWLPTGRVFPGLAYINSSKTGAGQVEQVSGPCTLTFGTRDERSDPILEAFEQRCCDAGIQATLSDDIQREMWTKLVWICAFAGITTLFRSKIGPIVDLAQGERLFRRCLDECFALAEARDAGLTEETKRRLVEKIEYYKTEGRDAKTSLLLDIENGRRTEVETMHGTLVRYADASGMDVPVLQAIYAVIRLHEASVGNSA